MRYIFFVLGTLCIFCTLWSVQKDETPKLPIGMNIPSNNYYSTSLIYRDVMKTSTKWLSLYRNPSEGPTTPHLIPTDEQGYPIELPYLVPGESKEQIVRFMINNYYKGRYVLKYDGEGEIRPDRNWEKKGDKIILKLDGKGGHYWLDIKKSKRGNHVRNIQILPEESADDTTTLFDPLFIEGLRPFHCIRFMDWIGTNGSDQKTWDQRSKPDFYTQGIKGMAIEHAIELCNLLHTNAWFCIPHQANDEYIHNFAQLVHERLDPSLKVYVEYSNELWNWIFPQARYPLDNAPGALDSYVSEDLAKISPKDEHFQRKDAYMMQRTFKIWSDVFGDSAKDRLVRVAAVQHVWVDNTRIILEYLFKKDKNGKPLEGPLLVGSTGAGCDALSPAGYFYYAKDDVKKWESMDPALLTPGLILESVENNYWNVTGKATKDTAVLAKAYNIDYIVYEGGQHLVPPDSKEGPIANAIWDAQIDPKMYDIYMTMFRQLASPEVDCKLFCAFSYVGERKSRWGSWGHLESVDQLKDPSKLMQVAPKFQALLDANTNNH